MNQKFVIFTVGRVVLIEAALLVLPLAVSLLYGESCALDFALTIVVALGVGSLLSLLCRGKHGDISIKDSFMVVALTWIVLSAIGANYIVSQRRSRLISTHFLKPSAASPPRERPF